MGMENVIPNGTMPLYPIVFQPLNAIFDWYESLLFQPLNAETTFKGNMIIYSFSTSKCGYPKLFILWTYFINMFLL